MSVILGAAAWVFVWSWEKLCSYSTKECRLEVLWLISYRVISWHYLCVFRVREVGTRLFSAALEDKWAIKLLCPWKSFTVLEGGLQRKNSWTEKKKISVILFNVNQHRVDCEQDPEFLDSFGFGDKLKWFSKNIRCPIICPCFHF